MMEFDLSIEEDGVRITGHVTVNGNRMFIHMVSPYASRTEIRSTFFHRVPRTEDAARADAELRMRLSYRRKRDRMMERDSKTAEEWEQEAKETSARLHALNTRLKLLHDIIMGDRKADLKAGLISQREYAGLVKTFRERTVEERENADVLQRHLRRAKSYAAELRELRCK